VRASDAPVCVRVSMIRSFDKYIYQFLDEIWRKLLVLNQRLKNNHLYQYTAYTRKYCLCLKQKANACNFKPGQNIVYISQVLSYIIYFLKLYIFS